MPSATPTKPDWQHLENIACAYWQSESLFTALRLELFTHLASPCSVDELASLSKSNTNVLCRLLSALETLGLLEQNNGKWCNSPLTTSYLSPSSDKYLGNFLLYRRYLQPTWQGLTEHISSSPPKAPLNREQSYEDRTFHYVQALDELSKIKAKEIFTILDNADWRPPILDIGGGAGTLSRTLIKTKQGKAFLFELPEVIAASRKIYPTPEYWQDMHTVAGDFRNHSFDIDERFSLIIIGNFLHTYPPKDARQLLRKAISLTTPKALILIHDYFPDQEHDMLKGQLYDLNMMLNTYDGHCHQAKTMQEWLLTEGWQGDIYNLHSDSALILASKTI